MATLLSFYWQADDSDLVKAAAGKVWADMLERFSQDEIAKACRRWIANETRRPTPAEIIKLCVEERPRPQVVYLSAPRDLPPPQTAEERAASSARIDALLRESGFGHIVRRMERSGEE